jgi:nitronate monooxygenase
MPKASTSVSSTDRLGPLRAGLCLPLIAAPMFLVSGPELVLAACRAGIIGAFPAPNARTLATLDEWLARIVAEHAAMGPAGAGPWALNLVTHSSYDRLAGELELVDRYQPPLVITALGSPAPAVARVHRYGGKVFADVSTLPFARKAAAAGADGLVLVCAGAGGHTGALSPFAFVSAVREFFDGAIVLAGSISNGEAVRAAELLGADLAYAGTPFIAAQESLAPPAYREMLVRGSADDLVLTRAFTGASASYLRESIVAAGLDPDALVDKDRMDLSGAHGPAKAWKNIWSAGQGVGTIHAVEPAAAIVERYRAGYAAALQHPAFGRPASVAGAGA